MRIHSTISRSFLVAGLLGLGVMTAAPAYADGFVTPFAGVNFSGAVGKKLNDAVDDNSKLTYGVSFGWMGAGIIGVEGDIGYAPKFFAPGANIGKTNVLTAMGNVIVGIPVGGQHGAGIRPYIVAGAGLLRTNVTSSLSSLELNNSNAGFDLGGGVNIYFADHVGIRGDVRYFRDFSARDANTALGFELGTGHLDFWRGTAGVVFRF